MKFVNKIKMLVGLSPLFFIPINAFAFGSVVTDMGAYSYYAEQIEAATSQLKKMEEQIKLATDTYNQISNIDDNLKGNYNRAVNAAKRLKDLRDIEDLSEFSKIRRSIQYADGTLSDLLDSEEYAGTIDKNIDSLFGEGSSEWTQLSAIKSKKQEGYKNTIINAELAQAQARLQLETLDEYSAMVNSTTNSKDAQDATNTLMLEMLENQRQMILLMSEVSKNLAVAAYDGITPGSNEPTSYTGNKITDSNYWGMEKKGVQTMDDCKNNSSKDCNSGLFDDAW